MHCYKDAVQWYVSVLLVPWPGEGGQESPELLQTEAKEKQEQEQLTILENNNTLVKQPGLLHNGG